MFSGKFYVDTKRKNALMLRITNNRRKVEMATGLRMDEETFMDAMSPKPKPNNIRYKAIISRWQMIIEDVRLGLVKDCRGNEDVKVIRKILKEALFSGDGKENNLTAVKKRNTEECSVKTGTFKAFFLKHKEYYERRSTRESNEYTLSVMEKFSEKRGVPLGTLNFEDINYAWLSDFDRFMKRTGLSQNTRRIHFANIRAAVNDAYKRELTDADPFRRFRLKTEKTAKRSMSAEELPQLFDYPAEQHAVYYRDMFKLIFMLIGINTVDLYGLKDITKEGRIEYKRSKTGRLYSIKVEPEALEIIKRYQGSAALLNIADKYKDHRYFRRDTNDALRLIGEVKRVGRGGKKEYKPLWPEVTTYWARHTWASIAADLDIPDATISLALGHAGENRVTDIYIKRNQKKVDEANRRVLDWVLYGKR